MTKATVKWGRREYSLTVRGHAGGGEPGKDIICAGISTLSQALLQTLMNAKERGRTELDYRIQEGKNAELEIRAGPKLGYETEIKAYFRLAVTGLKMLEDAYPKNIEVWEV